MKGHSRRKLLRGVTLGGAGVAGVALLGCARNGASKASPSNPSQGSAGAPQSGGTLNISVNQNPPTLDPQRSTVTATGSLASAVMSHLFRFKLGLDPRTSFDHDIENDLTVSWEAPDATTWTIKLRPDARFHSIPPVNGHAVEAEDIKATFMRGVQPPNPTRGSLDMIDPDHIETPSKDTVVFRLKYPYAPFLSILATPNYSEIFPREILTNAYDSEKQIIGSGPFIFDSYEPDVAVSLKKNPSYYEKGVPAVDEVRQVIIPTQAQALAQFTAGKLDILTVAPNDLAAAQKNNPTAHLIAATAGGFAVIYFQVHPGSPFDDIRLRQAVSLALDRDAIGKTIYNGHYDICFHVKLTMGKWALTMDQLDPSVQQYYKLDLARAKQLFEQAGASNLAVNLAYPAKSFSPESDTYAQTVNSMLTALPWKDSLLPIDFNKDFVGGGKGMSYGNYPVDTMLWGGIAIVSDVDEFLFRYYDSKSTTNREKISDPTLDTMFDKARSIVDTEERRKAYLDIQKYLAAKMYSVSGLPIGNSNTLLQPSVQNYFYATETSLSGITWSRLWLRR